MATNDFLPFANGGGANVLTQAQYAALTALLSGGYQSGVANSAQMNKTWRQSSIMAAVLGQFAADYSGNNSVDDGTIATLEANLVAAIRSATKTGVILADTGAANAYTAVNAPPLVAGTWVDGVVQQVRIAHANTGASTYAPDGLTAIPIYGLGLQPLQGGELYAGGTAILMKQTITGVNSGNPIAILLECAGGAQQVAPATQSGHALQLGQATGRLLGIQRFTSSGTYTPTAGTNRIVVRAIGGGGAGGGSANNASTQVSGGSGGASGSYAEVSITSGFSGAAVTIGAAGVGAANSAGGSGGTTSFGSLVSCPGGGGGQFFQFTTPGAAGFTGQGAPGATPTLSGVTALVSTQGQPGLMGLALSSAFASGQGAASPLGGGGVNTTSGTGGAGAGFGAGGAGASAANSGSQTAGGNGSSGVVIVFEYA